MTTENGSDDLHCGEQPRSGAVVLKGFREEQADPPAKTITLLGGYTTGHLSNALELRDNPDAAACCYFNAYLASNRESALVLKEMAESIEHFRDEAPEIEASNCMDGRTNTTDPKGCPPTTVHIRRSHGNKVDTRRSNTDFWNSVNLATVRAEVRTPGKPALMICSAHKSELNGCCAAHAKPNDRRENVNRRALQAVIDQALEVQNGNLDTPAADRLYCMAAMKNTDNGAMAFYSPVGTKLFNADEVIRGQGWLHPEDVFSPLFLDTPIADADAHPSIHGRTLRSFLAGEQAAAFADPRVKIALEAYILKQFNGVSRLKGEPGRHPLLHPAAATSIESMFQGAENVPESLKGFLAYMVSWNLSYAIDQNKKLEKLKVDGPAAVAAHAGHGEEIIGYGEGFEAATRRNNMLLVKPGSGDDAEAMRIAAHVLGEIQQHANKPQWPLVHINIQLDSPLNTWEQYTKVIGRMRSKIAVVKAEYPANPHVRILTTYSYDQGVEGVDITKQFFPLNADPTDPSIISPGMSLLSPDAFRVSELRGAETEAIAGSAVPLCVAAANRGDVPPA